MLSWHSDAMLEDDNCVLRFSHEVEMVRHLFSRNSTKNMGWNLILRRLRWRTLQFLVSNWWSWCTLENRRVARVWNPLIHGWIHTV